MGRSGKDGKDGEEVVGVISSPTWRAHLKPFPAALLCWVQPLTVAPDGHGNDERKGHKAECLPIHEGQPLHRYPPATAARPLFKRSVLTKGLS